MNWEKIKHFTEKEFRCSCGCKKAYMDQEFVEKLDELREKLNHPIYINSGYRCPEHNAKVGGVPNSEHTRGLAADISTYGKPAVDLLTIAFQLNFTGFGIKQKGNYSGRFIHLDLGTGPTRPAVWTY